MANGIQHQSSGKKGKKSGLPLLRFFDRSQRPSRQAQKPGIKVHLPINDVCVAHPRTESSGEQQPSDVFLSGEVEVIWPESYGKRLIRGLRVVLRGCSILNLGPGREKEIDVVFEHEHLGGHFNQGAYYNPYKEELKIMGVKTGKEFAMKDRTDPLFLRIGLGVHVKTELPATDDVNPSAQMVYYLIVQLIGQDPDPTPREPHLSLYGLEKHNHLLPFPPFPEIPPLEHSITDVRVLNIVHNPSAPGRLNTLDVVCRQLHPDLGLVDFRCVAEEFTVAGPVSIEATLPDLSSRAMMYAIRASVRQEQVVKSPRDGTEISSTEVVPFATIGSVPETKLPDQEWSTLWRGNQAGGSNSGPWSAITRSRFPHSSQTRMSTVPGIVGPITLKHALVFDIFYNVKDPESGSSGETIRRFQMQRDVIFPSCQLSSSMVDLPGYAPTSDLQRDISSFYQNTSCSSCHRPLIENTCSTCAVRSVVHVRHDPEYQSSCSVCSDRRLIPKGKVNHSSVGYCACVDWIKWKTGSESADTGRVDLMSELDKLEKVDYALAMKLKREDGDLG